MYFCSLFDFSPCLILSCLVLFLTQLDTSQANALAPNWGQIIFQSANEIANNQLAKQRMAEVQADVAKEKEWWDRRKDTIKSDFMKELEDETTADDDKTASDSRKGSVVAASPAQKNTNTATSDDDAVLVDAGGPASDSPSKTPGSAKKKKSGGKKS